MRRAMTFAFVLLWATSAVGQVHRTPSAVFGSGSPKTTDNDSSCDIGLYPAATLLLPNFEVDVVSPASSAVTTLFTVTNVSPNPQIATAADVTPPRDLQISGRRNCTRLAPRLYPVGGHVAEPRAISVRADRLAGRSPLWARGPIV